MTLYAKFFKICANGISFSADESRDFALDFLQVRKNCGCFISQGINGRFKFMRFRFKNFRAT